MVTTIFTSIEMQNQSNLTNENYVHKHNLFDKFLFLLTCKLYFVSF